MFFFLNHKYTFNFVNKCNFCASICGPFLGLSSDFSLLQDFFMLTFPPSKNFPEQINLMVQSSAIILLHIVYIFSSTINKQKIFLVSSDAWNICMTQHKQAGNKQAKCCSAFSLVHGEWQWLLSHSKGSADRMNNTLLQHWCDMLHNIRHQGLWCIPSFLTFGVSRGNPKGKQTDPFSFKIKNITIYQNKTE